MTRDDIIRMAREAKLPYEYDTGRVIHLKELEHFAELIEKHLSYDGIHTCNDQCQRPACVAIREEVEREREACAMEAEYEAARWPYAPECREPCEEIAKAIRARGNK